MSLFPFTYALACWPEGPTFYQHPNAKEPSLRLRSRGIRGHAAAIGGEQLKSTDTGGAWAWLVFGHLRSYPLLNRPAAEVTSVLPFAIRRLPLSVRI